MPQEDEPFPDAKPSPEREVPIDFEVTPAPGEIPKEAASPRRVPFTHRGVTYRAELQPSVTSTGAPDGIPSQWIIARVTDGGDQQWVAHMNFDPNERAEDVVLRARAVLDRVRRS